MKTSYLLWILLSLFGFSLDSIIAQMSKNQFRTFIEDRCYNYSDQNEELINGQEYPLAQTLENFLYLVEKLELANPDLKMQDVAAILLKNYTYENLKRVENEFETYNPPGSRYASAILNYWQQKLQVNVPNHDNPFDDSEICNLYYMLSHTVNDTAWAHEPSFYFESVARSAEGKAMTEVKKTPFPREQGVVAIEMTKYAVALGRVIGGIFLGLTNKDTKEILIDLVADKSALPEELRNVRVDSLYVLTLGDMLALASWNSKKMIGNGKWSSVHGGNKAGNQLNTTDICPNVYNLVENATSFYTYSLFRGGVDGLILGNIVEALDMSNVRLSQLLRMYYNGKGIPSVGSGINEFPLSFCFRNDHISPLFPKIKEELKNSIFILSDLLNGVYENNKYQDAMSNYLREKDRVLPLEPEFADICSGKVSSDVLNLPCETPSDVIVVLDTSNGFLDKQQILLGHLANELKLWHGGSKMTVLLDKRNGTTGLALEELLPETSCSACVACYITQYKIETGGAEQEKDFVIQAIDKFLYDKREQEIELNGAPGKVLIYFNYAAEETTSYRLTKVLKDLFLNNLDLTTFAIGKNKDVLLKYARDYQENAILGVENDLKALAKTLAGQICATPAALKYTDCAKHQNERSAVHEGFITPNTIQRWALDSKYFLKSFAFKIFFHVDEGDIRLCHNRAGKPEFSKNCMETNSTNRHLEVHDRNPCKGFNVVSCPPLYFTIIGLEKTNGQGHAAERRPCEDEHDRCKTLDQIKFKVTHEGIQCSGCRSLSSTMSLLIISFIVYTIFTKNS